MELKATELRIGNYVEYYMIDTMLPENEWEWVLNRVDIRDLENIEDNNSYRAIPLTEKWLLDFGWGKDEYDFTYVDNTSLKQLVLYYDVKNKMFLMETNSDIIEFKDIQYVHQFQNLIFALTNEELTINTPTRE